MISPKYREVNAIETGRKLEELRLGSKNLRRHVCNILHDKDEEYASKFVCGRNCEDCNSQMDNKISLVELGQVFGVSDSVVTNWEKGKTLPPISVIIYYAALAGIKVKDIIVYEG